MKNQKNNSFKTPVNTLNPAFPFFAHEANLDCNCAKNTAKPTCEASRIGQKNGRAYLCTALAIALCFAMTLPVFASTTTPSDPIASIGKLSDFVFSAIQAVGVIFLGMGVLQIGMSFKSHDAAQRANGMLAFFGGLLVACAKPIVDMIV